MMPVSPWFYTNLPQYKKNWVWRGDDMWHNRWQQVLKVQPQFVEVSQPLVPHHLIHQPELKKEIDIIDSYLE